MTVSEDNAKFEAIILIAKEAQQPTMESSAKSEGSTDKSEGITGKEDKNLTLAEEVSSGSPVQLDNRPPHHHLHPQVVEEDRIISCVHHIAASIAVTTAVVQ